jgi:signal transduction histidine kinase
MRLFRGLQAKMTASYVLFTAGAVVLVEAAVLGLLVPNAVSANDIQTRLQSTAAAMATKLSGPGVTRSAVPGAVDLPIADGAVPKAPDTVQADDSGGIAVPRVSGPAPSGPTAAAVALVVSRTGQVLASSYPAVFPVGSYPALPFDPATRVKGSGSGRSGGGPVLYALGPVSVTPQSIPNGKAPEPSPAASSDSRGAATTDPDVEAAVYVQVPEGSALTGSRDLGPSLKFAALVLVLLLPVGAVFGYLSTRRTVRRVRALEDLTSHIAAGELDQRAPVSGHDELAGLESGFNTMAERLSGSLDAERQLSGAAARAAERTRIARELHDSVSQDLFSLGLLAGGLRKALPDGSPLQAEVAAMESTSRRAIREMQALLLELRPIPMEDLGLAAALTELCQAYRTRLGVDVGLELGELHASAAVEHGLLRVAQESLANAVKHGDPAHVSLSLTQSDGMVQVRVVDDGCGFDGDADAGRSLGLGLASMRERVTELGGELHVQSAPGSGTTVSASVPAGAVP